MKGHNNEQLDIDRNLTLREVTNSEAEIFYAQVENNRSYLAEYLPWAEKNTLRDSEEFIQKIHESRAVGSEYGFGIYVEGVLVGHTSLMRVNEAPEIGYWISRSYAGQGITTKATAEVTRFGFEALGLRSIVIKAAVDNTGSNKIAQKLGYELSGTEKSDNGTTINVWRKTNE